MEDAPNPPAQPETSETPSAPIETPQPPLSVADIPGLHLFAFVLYRKQSGRTSKSCVVRAWRCSALQFLV